MTSSFLTSFWRALVAAGRHLLLEDGLVVAGYVAFTAVFALFPFLMMLVAIAGFLGHGEAAGEIIDLGLEIVPPEVAAVLRPAVADVRNSASSGVLTFGLVLHTLVRVLGARGHPPCPRSRLRNQGSAQLPAQSGAEHRAGALRRHRHDRCHAGPGRSSLHSRLGRVAGPPGAVRSQPLSSLRLAIGLTLLLAITLCLHLVLPATRLRLAEVLPGTLLSVTLWAIAAELYSVYLQSIAMSYSVTYGSLAGIVLTLFFFYISAAVFVLGAELNGHLRRNRHEASAAPDPQPERAVVSSRANAAVEESNISPST